LRRRILPHLPPPFSCPSSLLGSLPPRLLKGQNPSSWAPPTLFSPYQIEGYFPFLLCNVDPSPVLPPFAIKRAVLEPFFLLAPFSLLQRPPPKQLNLQMLFFRFVLLQENFLIAPIQRFSCTSKESNLFVCMPNFFPPIWHDLSLFLPPHVFSDAQSRSLLYSPFNFFPRLESHYKRNFAFSPVCLQFPRLAVFPLLFPQPHSLRFFVLIDWSPAFIPAHASLSKFTRLESSLSHSKRLFLVSHSLRAVLTICNFFLIFWSESRFPRRMISASGAIYWGPSPVDLTCPPPSRFSLSMPPSRSYAAQFFPLPLSKQADFPKFLPLLFFWPSMEKIPSHSSTSTPPPRTHPPDHVLFFSFRFDEPLVDTLQFHDSCALFPPFASSLSSHSACYHHWISSIWNGPSPLFRRFCQKAPP